MKFRFLILLLIICGQSLAQKKSKKDYLIKIETNLGTMYAILYDETPKHKVNFIELVQKKFYQDLLFHRVINEFMIQGGDPTSKNATPEQALGSGGDDTKRIQFEFTPKRYHKIGALAAARNNNAAKASSSCQFYIVEGKKYTEDELKSVEKRINATFTEEQKNVYMSQGGTPFLDFNYTVFGQLIAGQDVVDKITQVKVAKTNRPLEDVKMNITMKKMKKKKIAKKYGYVFG